MAAPVEEPAAPPAEEALVEAPGGVSLFPSEQEEQDALQTYSLSVKEKYEEETNKRKQRAERFGEEFKEPKPFTFLKQKVFNKNDLRALKAAGEQHFITGFDIYAPEEQEAMRKRAEKFGIQPNLPPSAPGQQPRVGLSEAELEKRAQRAAKFGQSLYEPKSLDSTDCRETRRELSAETPRRWDTLHVYGVDRMSTRDVLNCFVGYGDLP